MQIRKILVPLSGQHSLDDPATLDSPALEYALRVGADFGAHVEALCVTRERMPEDVGWASVVPDYGIGELADVIERNSEVRRERARAAFDRAVATAEPAPAERSRPEDGFSVRFREVAGEIRETVGTMGMLADVIVVASSKARWDRPYRPILEACLRRTGRPVLVSPPRAAQTFATQIAIAWNGSVEASRAVAASIELARAAERVVVLSYAEEEADSDPESLTEYLAWHGVEAKAVSLEASRRGAGEAILAEALERECDLLVLGSYLRTRAHTLLYGSVTEHVMGHPSLPALLVP